MLQKDNRCKILRIFFEDPIPNGAGFQLREISRMAKIAPSSVKNYLHEFEKKDLVFETKHRIYGYPMYNANRDSENFRFLKKLDNIARIKDSGLLDYLFDKCMPNAIFLFGSAAKGEDIKDSDIDLFVLSKEEKLDLGKFEKMLSRKINLLFSEDFNKLGKELRNNIVNGIILKGYLKVF